MKLKMSFALVTVLCAGCGAPSSNVPLATHSPRVPAQTSHDPLTHDPAIEKLLIDQACYAYTECRTTSHGLGV